ncbi:MAG: hypothetical protein WCX65_07830 [bacterium]
MKKEEIGVALEAVTLTDCGSEPAGGYETVCSCDLMSDLLAIMNEAPCDSHATILLTGLTNPQVIRTCEMVDIRLIVFLRGRQPTNEMVELAGECGITIMCSPHTMFKGSGILHSLQMKDVHYK